MVRDYMVVDNNNKPKLHWNTGSDNDWGEFLLDCRNKLKSGEYESDYVILIEGHEYCKVGDLL